MIEVTIQQAAKRFGKNEGDIAIAMKVSKGLISKIKNGASPITTDTQEKFARAFPGYVLKGGAEKWKNKYLEEKEKCNKLEEEIISLQERIKTLEKRIRKSAEMLLSDIENSNGEEGK